MTDSYKQDALLYVRQAMERLGVSPTELARKIGVSSSTLTRPLNNPDHPHAVSGRTLQLIAKALNEPLPAELKDGADESANSDGPDVLEIPEYNARFAAGGALTKSFRATAARTNVQ